MQLTHSISSTRGEDVTSLRESLDKLSDALGFILRCTQRAHHCGQDALHYPSEELWVQTFTGCGGSRSGGCVWWGCRSGGCRGGRLSRGRLREKCLGSLMTEMHKTPLYTPACITKTSQKMAET